jgi:ankyrin repeat protein
MVEILLKNKADINLAKKDLSPKPVFIPAFNGYEELLLMLIERGANLDGIWNTVWNRFSLGVLAILIEHTENVPEGALQIWKAESNYKENQ